MAGKRITIGDVFSVDVEDNGKKFFQYVANDETQLNSSVIRAFKKSYCGDKPLDLAAITHGEVEFYAHVFIRIGLKMGYWQKIGHIPEVGQTGVLFRDSEDYGNPKVRISTNWYVWKINEPFVTVGKLAGEKRNAEIGVVISPDSIVHRIRTGKYDFIYPSF